MWRRVARYSAGAGATLFGVASCYNMKYPMNVIWDLDETLVSSEERYVKNPKPGKERVLRVEPRQSVEHIDDDGLHFVTTVRPHAFFVLKLLKMLPGCQQFVSTSASIGYMNNVLELLDPSGNVFKVSTAGQSSRGKNVHDTLPPGCDPDLKRTVLVDNRASCHKPQPRNGIVLPDFYHPAKVLVLRDAQGSELGRFPASGAELGAVPLTVGSAKDQVTVVERRSVSSRDFFTSCERAGAPAVVLFDEKREISCFGMRARDVSIPVVTVGALAGRALQAHHGAKVTIESVEDRELLKVLGRLFLCWLVPDVRWVLAHDSSASSI
eukprot:TRINITY_DN57164_c0_g1_i1.p1 TRINITY_DN57164_c0_g1~~TRINITY_DN57164_c0_g1_i1.p1  ORF type:complete len:324 (-),score=38.03 TRINITY_DN57164_c0_g1_i1:223-1194(-)